MHGEINLAWVVHVAAYVHIENVIDETSSTKFPTYRVFPTRLVLCAFRLTRMMAITQAGEAYGRKIASCTSTSTKCT